MTINQLTYLVAVVEGGINLSRASRRLGVSQPNISKQLALLETEIGSPLFERTGRRLHALTPVGRQLFRHALNVKQEIACLYEEASPQAVENVAVIATTAATTRYVLPGMLAAAASEMRGVAVDVQTLAPDDIARAVLEGRCDVGLISGSVRPDPDLLLLPWYRWRYRLIFPRTGRIASELQHNGRSLRDYPIAACASVAAPRPAVMRAMEQLGITPQICMVSPDPDEVKDAVRSRQHVGLIAEMAYSEQTDNDLFARESPAPFPTLMAWIAIRRRSPLREGVSTFLNGIASHLRPATVEHLRRQAPAADPGLLVRGIRVPRYG